MSSQIYKKHNWQRASAELSLTICTARVEGCRAGPRALLLVLRHYMLWMKIILVDFNLAVSTPTAKPPNLIPHQIFRLYGISKAIYINQMKPVDLWSPLMSAQSPDI